MELGPFSDAVLLNLSTIQTGNGRFNNGTWHGKYGWVNSFPLSLKILLSLIILSAAIGNALVCVVVLFTKILRKSLSSYLILSLALSDLLASCLVMTFELDIWVKGKWIHDQTTCRVWTTAYLFVIPSSIWNMLTMTVDRYKSLSDPLNRYKAKPFLTRKRIVVVIAFIWIYSLTFSLIPHMGWNVPQYTYTEGFCGFDIAPAYSMLSSGLNFLVPMVLMSFFHLKIIQIARRFNVATSAVSQRNQAVDYDNKGKSICKAQVQKTFQKNTKYAKMVCVLVCAFLICWMPFTLLSIAGIILPSLNSKVPSLLFDYLLLLGYLNSALNPFLYSFNNRNFRRGFKNAFRTIFKRCHCQRYNNNNNNNNDNNNNNNNRLLHTLATEVELQVGSVTENVQLQDVTRFSS